MSSFFGERFHTYLYEIRLHLTLSHSRFSHWLDLNETKSDAAAEKFPPKCVNIETSATHLTTCKCLSNENLNFFNCRLKIIEVSSQP